jgi:hypothetical protein
VTARVKAFEAAAAPDDRLAVESILMGWREVEEVATSELLSLYSVDSILCFRFAVAGLGLGGDDAHYMRYENVRALIADWINDARDIDLKEFKRHVVDAWVGQRSELGHFLPEMELVLAGSRALPPPRSLRVLLEHKALVGQVEGTHPVMLGAFPSVRIDGGTIQHVWKLDGDFVTACSRWFREHHHLLAKTEDPYVQMLDGADEPADFAWQEKKKRRT